MSRKELIDLVVAKALKNPRVHGIPPYRMGKPYIGPSEWYVQYEYWSLTEKKYKRDKVRPGLWGMTLQEKRSILDSICSVLNVELKDLNKQGVYRDENPETNENYLFSMLEWVQHSQSDAKINSELKKTFSKLEYNLKAFFKAKPLYDLIEPWAWSEEVMIVFIEFLKEKKLAGKTINDLIYGVDKIKEYLVKKKVIKSASSFEELRIVHAKNETEKYRPLTHEEKEAAFDYFRANYPDYYLYLLGVYYTCIRPGEQHRLQVSNYDLNRRSIYVPWFAAKYAGLSQHVQILEPYHQALTDFGVPNLPRNWYLFGARCAPSSERFLQEDYSTKHWNRHRTKIGLDKGITPYGLKHTFNIDYVENNKYNIDWEFLRRHNRHATVQQTMEYISRLTAYFLDETQYIILNYHKTPGK